MNCLGSFFRVFPWEHMWVPCHQLLIQFHCFQSHLFLPSFCSFLLTFQFCLRAPILPGLGCDASTVSLSSYFAPPINTVDTPSFSKHFPFSVSVTSHLLAGLPSLCLLILGEFPRTAWELFCVPHSLSILLSGLALIICAPLPPAVQCGDGGLPASAKVLSLEGLFACQ